MAFELLNAWNLRANYCIVQEEKISGGNWCSLCFPSSEKFVNPGPSKINKP